MRMRYLLVIGTFICFLQLNAQNHKVSLRCLYTENYVKDADSPNQQKQDEFALDITENGQSAFYSVYERRIKEQRDSLLRLGMTASEIINQQRNLPRTHQYFECYKNLPAKGRYTYFDKMVKTYTYEESLPSLDWAIFDETKSVLGYKCQKAIAHLDGRTWEVWFTMDIPVSDGPWLFTGLPGLILEVSDSDGIFHFKAIGLEKQFVSVGLPKDKKCIKTTRKEFLSFRKEYYDNPEAGLRSITGYNLKIKNADGKTSSNKRKNMNFFEKRW